MSWGGVKFHQVESERVSIKSRGDEFVIVKDDPTLRFYESLRLFKRKIIGIHHWVSDKHLQRYVDELAWAFNRRDLKPSPRMNSLFECVEGRLTYRALIGKAALA